MSVTNLLPCQKLVLTMIEDAAVKGMRCPTGYEIDAAFMKVGMGYYGMNPSAIVSSLAKLGLIEGYVTGRNWRVVKILAGPHKGKSTQESPIRTRRYLVFNTDGVKHI